MPLQTTRGNNRTDTIQKNTTYRKPETQRTQHTPSPTKSLDQNSAYTSHPPGVRTPRAVRCRLVHTGEIPPARGDAHLTRAMLHGIRGHLSPIRGELVRLGRGPLTLTHKLSEIPIIEVEALARQALRPTTILHPEVKVHTGIREGELSLDLRYVAPRPTLPREERRTPQHDIRHVESSTGGRQREYHNLRRRSHGLSLLLKLPVADENTILHSVRDSLSREATQTSES